MSKTLRMQGLCIRGLTLAFCFCFAAPFALSHAVLSSTTMVFVVSGSFCAALITLKPSTDAATVCAGVLSLLVIHNDSRTSFLV